MTSPTDWADRRGMFQPGKEKHEPGSKLSRAFGDPIRRSSTSSTGESPLEKTTSNTSGAGSPTSSRRRSSTQDALFNNLTTHKRGSKDYGERRASINEMNAQQPGLVGGWFNKTFKGVQQPSAGGASGGMGGAGGMGGGAGMGGMGQGGLTKEQKRGVME